MATIGQDLRYAIRRMRATPGFTVAAIATLALGLGVNSAVLSMAEAIFLRPLPLPEASRLGAGGSDRPQPAAGLRIPAHLS
jgi:putative ABC transport system permease protein